MDRCPCPHLKVPIESNAKQILAVFVTKRGGPAEGGPEGGPVREREGTWGLEERWQLPKPYNYSIEMEKGHLSLPLVCSLPRCSTSIGVPFIPSATPPALLTVSSTWTLGGRV